MLPGGGALVDPGLFLVDPGGVDASALVGGSDLKVGSGFTWGSVMPKGQGKHWFFTDNTVNKELWDKYKDEFEYLSYQLERAETTGKLHFQGIFGTKKKKRQETLERLLPGVHLELTKSREGATVYVNKVETRVDGPWTYGNVPTATQGKRNDLEEVRGKIIAGANMSTVADENFASWCRYRQAFKEFRDLKAPRRNWTMEIKVFWGPTGTGKSARAFDEAGPDSFVCEPDKNGFYFSGYDGQENVVWDEFSGGCCDIKYLLRLLDRYPMKVRGLYQMVEFRAKRIWITSNLHPVDWYTNAYEEHRNALMRRLEEFGEVVECRTRGRGGDGDGDEVPGNTRGTSEQQPGKPRHPVDEHIYIE